MDEFVRAQKKSLNEKKTSLYILVSQTTKTNDGRMEKNGLEEFLNFDRKKRERQSLYHYHC